MTAGALPSDHCIGGVLPAFRLYWNIIILLAMFPAIDAMSDASLRQHITPLTHPGFFPEDTLFLKRGFSWQVARTDKTLAAYFDVSAPEYNFLSEPDRESELLNLLKSGTTPKEILLAQNRQQRQRRTSRLSLALSETFGQIFSEDYGDMSIGEEDGGPILRVVGIYETRPVQDAVILSSRFAPQWQVREAALLFFPDFSRISFFLVVPIVGQVNEYHLYRINDAEVVSQLAREILGVKVEQVEIAPGITIRAGDTAAHLARTHELMERLAQRLLSIGAISPDPLVDALTGFSRIAANIEREIHDGSLPEIEDRHEIREIREAMKALAPFRNSPLVRHELKGFVAGLEHQLDYVTTSRSERIGENGAVIARLRDLYIEVQGWVGYDAPCPSLNVFTL